MAIWCLVAVLSRLRFLHRDRSGVAAVDIILVIAAVSIPLVMALVAFGDDIVGYLQDQVARLE